MPYRDVFDMNLPGVYLLHAAVLRSRRAPGDLAWRALRPRAGSPAPACPASWACCRPLGGVAAGAGAASCSGSTTWRAARGASGSATSCSARLPAGAARPRRRPRLERGGAPRAARLARASPRRGHHAEAVRRRSSGSPCGRRRGAGARRGSAARPSPPRALVLAGGLVAPALVFGWLAGAGGSRGLRRHPGWLRAAALQPGRARVAALAGRARYQLRLGDLLPAPRARPGSALAPRPARRSGRRARADRPGGASTACSTSRPGQGLGVPPLPARARSCRAARRRRPWPRPRRPRGARARRRDASAARSAASALAAAWSPGRVLGAKGVEALEPPWIAAKARRVDAVIRATSRRWCRRGRPCR